MKKEISAGGIIVRRKSRLWQVLRIRDAKGKWTFPKGIIEKGEDPLTTAIREIKEETGIYRLTYLTTLPVVTYLFFRAGLIQKTVHYFLFLSKGKEKLTPQTEEGISMAGWVSIQIAQKSIGYPQTNMPLLKEVQSYIASNDAHA